LIVLGGILAGAAALRLYWIDQPFVDFHGWRESSTAMMAENILHRGRVLSPEVNWDGPGPSYNGREFQLVTFIASLLYRVTGQVDWAGRIVGVAFGLWGIFALHRLVSLVWDERRALAGAAVMAILPGSLFIDREFLPDPAMVALITTGCWLTLRYLHFSRLRDLIGSVVVMTLGVLTKLTGLCVVLAIIYAAWSIRSPESRARLPRLLVAGVVMLMPVALYYGWAWHLSRTSPPYHFAGSQGFVWNSSFAAWWAEGYFADGLLRELTNIWTGLGLLLVVGALVVAPPRVETAGVERQAPASRFFHWWLLVSGGSYYLIGASHLVWQPYNFHLFDPPAAALAGHAVIVLADTARRHAGVWAARLILVGLPVSIAISGLPYLRSVYEPISAGGHRMGLALRDVSAPGDLVVTIPEFAGDPVAIYYSRRRGWVFPPASVWAAIPENWDQAIEAKEAAEWLDHLRHQGARWLAIVAPQRARLWRVNPDLAAYVERHFDVGLEAPDYVIFRAR
jgi:4-amino-4-deoxy-L-arabinose transferase-like glycosyltransferase